jgi:4-hydroxybenzoate polyprenyltransferase
MKPFRLKSIPFLDSLSNILYVIPAFSYYIAVTGQQIDSWIILGALAWNAGMHLYSAIPDIEPDKQTKINTTAVFLGEKKSLYLKFLVSS